MKTLIKTRNLIVTDVFVEKQRIKCMLDDGEFIFAKNENFQIYCKDCSKAKNAIRPHEILCLKDREYRCQSCNKRGARNPFYHRQHAKEFKNRLSAQRKGVWYVGEKNVMYGKTNYDVWMEKFGEDEAGRLQRISNEKNKISNTGINNGFYGKTHTDEAIGKIVEGNKKYLKNMTYAARQLRYKNMVNAQKKIKERNPDQYVKSRIQAGHASAKIQGKYKINKLEQFFQNALLTHGILCEYAFILNGKFQYDFRISGTKILIECQGDYWHGNPSFFNPDGTDDKRKLNEIQISKMELDPVKKKYAEDAGWQVLSFWEYRIKNHIEDIIKEIQNEIDTNK